MPNGCEYPRKHHCPRSASPQPLRHAYLGLPIGRRQVEPNAEGTLLPPKSSVDSRLGQWRSVGLSARSLHGTIVLRPSLRPQPFTRLASTSAVYRTTNIYRSLLLTIAGAAQARQIKYRKVENEILRSTLRMCGRGPARQTSTSRRKANSKKRGPQQHLIPQAIAFRSSSAQMGIPRVFFGRSAGGWLQFGSRLSTSPR